MDSDSECCLPSTLLLKVLPHSVLPTTLDLLRDPRFRHHYLPSVILFFLHVSANRDRG